MTTHAECPGKGGMSVHGSGLDTKKHYLQECRDGRVEMRDLYLNWVVATT